MSPRHLSSVLTDGRWRANKLRHEHRLHGAVDGIYSTPEELMMKKDNKLDGKTVPTAEQRKKVPPPKAAAPQESGTKVAKPKVTARPPNRPLQDFSYLDDVVNGDLAQHRVRVGEEDALERHLRIKREGKQAMVEFTAANTPQTLAKSLANAMKKHKALAEEMGVTPASCDDVFECDLMTDCLKYLGTLSPGELRQRQFRLADWMMAYQCGHSGGRNQCPEDAMCKIPWMCSRDRHLSRSDYEQKNSITKGMSCDQHGPLIYAWDTLLMWVAAITDYDWCSELLGQPKLDRSIL